MCCRSNISDVLSVRSHLYPLLDQPVQPSLDGLAMGLLLGEDGRQFSGTCGIAEGLEGMDPGRVPEDRAGPSHEVIGQAVCFASDGMGKTSRSNKLQSRAE